MNLSTTPFQASIPSVDPLRRLYATRAAFAFAWAALLFASAGKPALATALLVLYPAWDAAITALDLRRRSAEGRTLQWVNFASSALTAVGIAVSSSATQIITGFGAWAIAAGLLQLGVGLARRRTLGGQWAMILSGAQSTLAGASFLFMAHAPDASVQKLAPYAVFGGIYFAVAAFRLKPQSA